MKKMSLFIAVVSSLAFLCCGCGSGKAPETKGVEIKVAYWGSPEEMSIIRKSIDLWQKQNPDIRVTLEHTPFSGYVSKILTRIAGGAAPDIIAAEVGLFTAFVGKDVFLDLKPYADSDEDFSISDFFPEVLQRFSVEGKLFGIPRDTAPFACVYYNKKLFDQAGLAYPGDEWTWAEFLDTAQKLTKSENGKITQFGFYSIFWQNFIYSNGGSLVDNVRNPKKCMLNKPESIEGLKFYVDLINKYRVSPTPLVLGNTGMDAYQLFSGQRIAMYCSGIWESPAFRKIKDFDWDVAMFPKGYKGVRGFGTGGTAYCVLKTTKNPQEAWRVIKALTGDEAQSLFAETGLAQPARKKIAEGEYWAKSNAKPLNKKMLNEAIKFVTYEPFHPKWREIMDLYVNPEFDLVFNGKVKVEEAVSKLAVKVNGLLKER
ncbi:MAG: sugar ABC transporter substrate-binding protein [Candidatus Omnitrophota bacterium]